MIYLSEKDTGKRFAFLDEEISELDNFIPDEAITMFSPDHLDLCDDKYGHWKLRLTSGRLFEAYGTTYEYDRVVRLIIKKHTGKNITAQA
jgi:hypothetical protein